MSKISSYTCGSCDRVLSSIQEACSTCGKVLEQVTCACGKVFKVSKEDCSNCTDLTNDISCSDCQGSTGCHYCA